MSNERKTKAQLSAELQALRQRVIELEAAEAACQQQDAARQPLDAALQASETRYRRLFETAQDGILLLDAATGQITDVNPFLEKLLGYSHAELTGQYLWEIGPFKDVAESKLAFEQLQTNEYIRYEDLPLETRAGQRIQVEFVSNVYRINGGKVIQCNVRDITARRQAADLLMASEEKYRILADRIADQFFGMDTALRYTYWNEISEMETGISAEDALGRSLQEVFPDTAGSPIEQFFLNALKTQKPATLFTEYVIQGQKRFFEIICYPSPEGLSVFSRNITQRRQAEEALRESETKLRAIVESSRDAIGVSKAGIHFFVNPAYVTMFGYQAASELIGIPILDLIAPAAREGIIQNIQRRTSGVPAPLAYETTGLRKDGTAFDMDVQASLYELEGEQHTLVILRDITDRKHSEAALRENEARYQKLIDTSIDGFWVVDREGRFLEVNDAYCAMTGYTRAAMLTMRISDLEGAETQEQTRAHLRRVIAQGGDRFESQHRCADGRVIEVEVNAVYQEDRQVFLVFINDITPRKRAEEAIQSLAKFPAENPNPVLRLRPNGIILYANEASHAILQEWGCAVGESVPAFWQAVIAAAFAERSSTHLDVQSDGRIWSFFIAPVGEAGYINLYGRDITERQQAESQREAALEALHDSERSLQDFINNSPDTIYVLDLLTHASRFLNRVEFLGYSQHELETQNSIMTALHPDDQPAVVDQWKQLTTSREDRIATIQYRVQNKQGVWEWIQQRTTILARAENGTPQKLLVTLSIITDRKQAENAVRQLNAELEQRVGQRTGQLEAANRELEAFSYSISHDLRAPLRAIDGFSRILIEEYAPHLDAQAQRYLHIVHTNVQQMGQLIDDLLAFSRLSRKPLNKQPVDVNKLVRQALDDARRARPDRSPELIVDDLPPCQADPALLKQVWLNLLSNAFKFTARREEARIEIGCQLDQDQPIYFVRDNGAGFDMQYADKLFGVFQRLHRSEEYEGTGVGLAIVKRIIDRHGGRIWAEAEVDRGAAFYFTL